MDCAKILVLSLAFLFPLTSTAASDSDSRDPWYRDVGEYISSRTVRMGLATDPNSKILTDGHRFDVSVGKRLPIYSWGQVSLSEGWAAGVDAGMLASLERSTSHTGTFLFATNTFDGFFSGWAAYTGGGWIGMFRYSHLSAHLVDNSPRIYSPTTYSQFWNELICGKDFPGPKEKSPWDLYFQGSVGLNNTSAPKNKQPRASLGADFGYSFFGPGSNGLILSADVLHAGVTGQTSTYSFFAGFGSVNRSNTVRRPFRVGVDYFTGSDYRNQFYADRQHWLALEVETEL
jgi:hypothetical protein